MLKLEKLNPHIRDQCISFQELGHLYTINDTLITDKPDQSIQDRGYTSVTTFIHNLFPKFDPEKIIPKMMNSKNWPNSKYFGMTKNEIKAQWNENGKLASEAGTAMHEDIELFYNDVEISNDSVEFQYFNKYLKDHSDFTPYRTEWTVWDAESKICGSVDMIYINDDGTLSIYDWKRCKEIKQTNNFQKCLHPSLKKLDDCNYEHYSLQLNVYKYIIEKNYGFKVKELAIVSMHPDNDNKSYKKFVVRDL